MDRLRTNFNGILPIAQNFDTRRRPPSETIEVYAVYLPCAVASEPIGEERVHSRVVKTHNEGRSMRDRPARATKALSGSLFSFTLLQA